MNVKSKIIVGFFIAAAWSIPAQAQQSMQLIEAWQAGSQLPSSTRQIGATTDCQNNITANMTSAPTFGYVVDSSTGKITDPASGITVRQSCVDPGGDPTPAIPYAGAEPNMQPLSTPPIGVCTEIWLVIGQSNAANHGRGRYTFGASGADGYDYAGNGVFYQASDPLHNSTGADAGPWVRLANMVAGYSIPGSPCPGGINRVIIANRAIGGTTIDQWAQGGNLYSSWLVPQVNDMLAHGLYPTRIFWHQGEGNSSIVSSQAQYDAQINSYSSNFTSMLAGLRGLGVSAPIYIAVATICNVRGPGTVIADATIDNIVQKEWGKQSIRQAQIGLPNGFGKLPGPNSDAIDYRLRLGCHFDTGGLDAHALLWWHILTGQ